MIGECHVEHGILTSSQWPTVFKTMHTIYVYIQGTHKYDIFVHPRTIFHVVYSSNISVLFLFAHFSIRVPVQTPMEAPSHPSWPAPGHTCCCNDRIKKQDGSDHHSRLSCSHVMQIRRAWKELHAYTLHKMEVVPPILPQKRAFIFCLNLNLCLTKFVENINISQYQISINISIIICVI